MPKRKKTKRHFKLIAFKAYHDTDQDILNWWNGIEEGDRSEVIRELIRLQLGIHPIRHTRSFDLPELSDVRRDTIWIKDALNDMPGYLERLIQQMTITAPAVVNAPQSNSNTSQASLSKSEAQRRSQRMRNTTW